MNVTSEVRWRKSSRSMQNGSCVEVGMGASAVFARDGKYVAGGALGVDRRTWRGLLDAIAQGDLD